VAGKNGKGVVTSLEDSFQNLPQRLFCKKCKSSSEGAVYCSKARQVCEC